MEYRDLSISLTVFNTKVRDRENLIVNFLLINQFTLFQNVKFSLWSNGQESIYYSLVSLYFWAKFFCGNFNYKYKVKNIM